MRFNLTLALTAALTAFVLTACGGSSSRTAERDVIDTVKAAPAGVPSWIAVSEPGEHACEIDHGGPHDPNYQPFEGRCRWDVERRGGVWLASFAQTWPCGIDGSSGCTHVWRYSVDADGAVTLVGEDGRIAPQIWQ